MSSSNIKRWPLRTIKEYQKRTKMLQEGRRLYERYEGEDLEDRIREFNKLERERFGMGLSIKKIEQFISGEKNNGRIGNPEIWKKHWLDSVKRYHHKRVKGKHKERRGEEDEEKHVDEYDEINDIREDLVIRINETTFDEMELTFEKRVEKLIERIDKQIKLIDRDLVKVTDSYEYAADIVKDFGYRIGRWENGKNEDVGIERINEILDLKLAGIRSERELWKEVLSNENSEAIQVLEIVESLFKKKENKNQVFVDEVLIGEIIMKCLNTTGLEDVGFTVFKLAISCGEKSRKDKTIEEVIRDEVPLLKTAERIVSIFESSGGGGGHVFCGGVWGGVAVAHAAAVCHVLGRLRKGAAMLWASHVAVAHGVAHGARV